MKECSLIETERLAIRHLSVEDVPKIFLMSQEEGMKKWLPDQVYENEEVAHEVVEFLISQYLEKVSPDKTPYVLGLVIKETKELIGHVGLSPIEEGIEIGYAIEEKYQGKGYATEAVKAMSTWALKELEIPSIWGIVDINNTISARVLEKSEYIFVKESENKNKYMIKA
ncbi:GNAT family N-acetyltransferase [Orenia marismortui]|uniref:RimJ/RimL family protein N-acetyltransferase n=1 Tax=Orenia marismortui TaxID=46469 RepID=A0A4R8H249_9FIRM|nr:GNAT family N-acetyltransferase [Orenia marismortui]TDX49154.1 RimJ/RimL family protein N-acetyltransferase [Orenia marismortui]